MTEMLQLNFVFTFNDLGRSCSWGANIVGFWFDLVQQNILSAISDLPASKILRVQTKVACWRQRSEGLFGMARVYPDIAAGRKKRLRRMVKTLQEVTARIRRCQYLSRIVKRFLSAISRDPKMINHIPLTSNQFSCILSSKFQCAA